MATIQVLEEGPHNLILHVTGAGGDAAALLADVSALNPPCLDLRIMKVDYDVEDGGLVTILGAATSDQLLLTCSSGSGQTRCWYKVGGIKNNAGAGKTGNLLITSTADKRFSLVLNLRKVKTIQPYN